MGRSCLNQVWAISFDWSALATWNKHSWTAFWKFFSGTPNLPGFCDVPGAGTWHLNSQVQGALYQVLCAWCKVPGDLRQVTWKVGKRGIPEKGLSKMQFRNAIFRSLVHSSQKLWPKPDSVNFAPCILLCKTGGSQNLGAICEQTPF